MILAWLVSRQNWTRITIIVAAVFATVASISTLFLWTGSPIAFVITITVLFGVMMGTMVIGYQSALYALAPASELGTAAGLLRTSGFIGTIVSSAIIRLVFHKGVSDAGLHSLAIVMVIVSALVLLLTLTDRFVMKPSGVR